MEEAIRLLNYRLGHGDKKFLSLILEIFSADSGVFFPSQLVKQTCHKMTCAMGILCVVITHIVNHNHTHSHTIHSILGDTGPYINL